MLTLCYLPTAGRLTVTVIKGRNLKAMDITGKSGKYSTKSIYTMFILICNFRSIRKSLSFMSREKDKKEENLCKKEYTLSYI